jgi:ankyrin repeat protein
MILHLQNFRYSSLHLAAERGDVELVKLLLRYGADPNVLDTVSAALDHIVNE